MEVEMAHCICPNNRRRHVPPRRALENSETAILMLLPELGSNPLVVCNLYFEVF